jgi:cytidyltransferase-like protein
MNDIICVSGGFDPLHGGHLAMFREAAKHGPLVVILNSDDWLLRKKGFMFLSWQERADIIGDLRYVTATSTVNDADDSVCEALRRLRPRFFANGGDRKPNNTPEKALCAQLGIDMLWNIGGGKANSSTDIARRAWVTRPWGRYVTLDEGRGYKVKKVIIDPGQSISLQFHHHRCEYWYMTGPNARVRLGNASFEVTPGAPPVCVSQGLVHKLSNQGTDPLTIIEIQSGDYLGEDDILRLEEEIGG